MENYRFYLVLGNLGHNGRKHEKGDVFGTNETLTALVESGVVAEFDTQILKLRSYCDAQIAELKNKIASVTSTTNEYIATITNKRDTEKRWIEDELEKAKQAEEEAISKVAGKVAERLIKTS